MSTTDLLKIIQNLWIEGAGTEETAGPVITISREYGCPGYIIGTELAGQLSKKQSIKGGTTKWKTINREILLQAADEIRLPSERINQMIHRRPPGLFVDLFTSFSTHYVPSDIEVKKKVAAIIEEIAFHGNAVIVGRAGAMITQNIPKSLHLHFYAPMEDRIEAVMKKKGISKEEAKSIITRVDQERLYIRKFFSGEEAESSFFDAYYNTSTLSSAAIVESIIVLARQKGLIRD